MALRIGKLFSLGGGDGEGPTGRDLTSTEGRVMALFDEIKAAVQQRRITATVGGNELVLDAGGKQLYRVISVKPGNLRFGKATAIESRSYDNLDNQLIIISQLFSEFSGLPGEFDMVSRPVPTPYPSKLEGFSPDELKFAYTRYAPAPGDSKPQPPPQPAEPPAAAPAPVAAPPPQPTPQPAPQPAPPPVAQPAPAPTPAPPPAPEPQFEAPPQPAAPAPVVASDPGERRQVATVHLTPEMDTSFHDLVSTYCDFTMVVNSAGEVLLYTSGVADWPDLASEIATDMLRWVKNTASVLPQKQLVVMRSQLSQSQSICFFADGELITFAVISSVAIGRLFVAAHEFVG
jgi:hypothetical protein